MSLAVITVNAENPTLDKKSSEVGLVARALEIAAQQIRSAGGLTTSGTMTDGGVTLGTWVLTPAATNP